MSKADKRQENTYTMANSVSWKTRLGYGTGHVLNDMCASMWFTYLLLFLHKVLEFDNTYAGIILMIGQLADGFSTVFVGIFSDSGDDFWLCLRFGTRKAWHLIGTGCVVLSFPFIFSPCVGCEKSHAYAQVVYYAAFVIIFQFGWAAVQISHLAAIPDLAHTQSERTGLTAIRYSMTVVSNILVYLTMLGFLNGERSADMVCPDDQPVFRNVMLVCIIVGSIATLIFHSMTKFPGPTENESQQEEEEEPRSPADQSQSRTASENTMTVAKWFREPQLYQIGIIYMATRLFVNLSQAYIPLYLQVTLQLHAQYVATVPLTMFISGFFTSFVLKKANDQFGRKTTYLIGGLIGISGCVWTHFGILPDDPNDKYYVFVLASLIGISGSTMLVTSLSLTAEFIGSNTGSSAFIYGLMSLTDKVSNGLAVVLIQHMIPSSIDTCVVCQLYFRDVIFFACGGAGILGVLGAISLFPVTVGVRTQTTAQRNVIVNEDISEATPLLANS